MQTSSSTASRWQFPRKFIEEESPSRKDGISCRRENSLRRLALAFCQDVGCLLKMNQYTIATAFVFWQRFFIVQSLSKNDPYLIAAACLLLAGKVEENFKSLQKITETSYFVRNKKDPKAEEAIKSNPKLLLSEMDRIVKAEEVLLITMNFDFVVNHPYRPLVSIIKDLGFNKPSEDGKNTQFCQIAWNFANDSLRTTMCLQPFQPTDIAAACINLASSTLKIKLPPSPDGSPWWTKYQVVPDVLKDIELQVMSLYRRKEDESKSTSFMSVPATPSLSAPSVKHQRTSTPSPTSALEVTNHSDSMRKEPSKLKPSEVKQVESVPASAQPSEEAVVGEVDAGATSVTAKGESLSASVNVTVEKSWLDGRDSQQAAEADVGSAGESKDGHVLCKQTADILPVASEKGVVVESIEKRKVEVGVQTSEVDMDLRNDGRIAKKEDAVHANRVMSAKSPGKASSAMVSNGMEGSLRGCSHENEDQSVLEYSDDLLSELEDVVCEPRRSSIGTTKVATASASLIKAETHIQSKEFQGDQMLKKVVTAESVSLVSFEARGCAEPDAEARAMLGKGERKRHREGDSYDCLANGHGTSNVTPSNGRQRLALSDIETCG